MNRRRVAPMGWIVAVATLVTIGSVLPLFLLGIYSTQIMADLTVTVVGIGYSAASYTVGLAVSSLLGHRLERLNLTLGFVVSVGFVGIGGTVLASADAFWGLALGAFLSGFGSGAVQMSSARILGSLAEVRNGQMFGWFQSAKPAAVAVAGVFGLMAGLGLSWRYGFLLVATVASVLGLGLARWCSGLEVPRRSPRVSLNGNRTMIALVFLMAGGFALTGISTTFLPDTVRAAQGDPWIAGSVLIVGGILAATARVVAGRLTDRTGWDEARLVAPGFALAGLGCLMISSLTVPWIITGCIFLFAFGWIFGGLLVAKGARLHPQHAGAVVGKLLFGGALGGAVGPGLFGNGAQLLGYGPAWALWGVMLLGVGYFAYRTTGD